MDERRLLDWNDTTPGDNPVCLVGAGFQKAALKSAMPSTNDIIEKTIQNEENQFPILSILYKKNISPNLSLNYIWENIKCLSLLLANYYHQIYRDYSSLNNKTAKVIEQYKNYNSHPHEIIWVVLELELKKMTAYHYDSNKIGAFKGSAISNMKSLISQSRKFTWISLNYDIVLEKMLVCDIKERNVSNLDFRVKYAFEPLLTNKSSTKEYFEKTPKTVEYSPKVYKERNGKWDKSKYSNDDSEHLLIKPHGSLNVVFETDNQNTYNKIHKIYYKDENNYFNTFDCKDVGYNIQQTKINEKRPWMIGYLSDDLKAELTSKPYISDLAHDLCKWNMAYSSFALVNATSLFILGYRMPREDQWVWARVKNIENKNLSIYVASGCSSDCIVQELKKEGFTNVEKVNNGYIDHI